MNIIFNAVYQPYTVLCTNQLAEYYKANNCFLVFPDETLYKTSPTKMKEYYFHQECMQAKYDDKIYNNALIPIDGELLKKFEPYMTIALKMCERVLGVDLCFEGRMEIIFRNLEYWNTLLTKEDINLYVSYDIPHEVYDYIIYALCEIKNIPCAFLHSIPVMGHSSIISNVKDYCPQISNMYKALYEKYKDTNIEDIPLKGAYLEHFNAQSNHTDNIVPFYMQGTQVPKTLSGFDRLKNIYKLITTKGAAPIVEWVQIQNRKYKFAKSKAGKYHKKWDSYCKEIDLTKKFVYFPLHLQPECTTSPMGWYFTWQILAIKMLRYALPDDVYIYIKENPKQTERGREENFIEKILQIDKVQIAPKTFDTYSLINNCIAVAGITGTALWEGLFKNKPGIIFGDFITQYAPGIFKVSTNEECKKAVNSILQNGPAHTLKELKIFLLAMSGVAAMSFSWCPPLEAKYSQQEISQFIFEFMSKYIDEKI